MTTMSRTVLLTVLLVGLMVVGGCASSKKPSATAAEPEGQTAATAPTPIPTPVEEQVVREPSTGSIPSVEVQEELPDDLQELNRRGYLRDVFFDTDQFELTSEAREILATNSQWLLQHPDVRILVEGHCDDRNTREYNLALGERRANAVRDYLTFLGVAGNRIETISYGEERPFALGNDESAWKLNRRAHFVIIAR